MKNNMAAFQGLTLENTTQYIATKLDASGTN